MKKAILIILIFLAGNFSYAADKTSQEYLQNHKHFAIMNPVAESVAEHTIKSALQKETGGKYKVHFEGYTLESMKKGIFKTLEITGTDVVSEEIPLPYVHVKSLSDYNYVDYTQNPVIFKSDMQYEYDILLSEESINKALKHSNYQTVVDNINNIAYPMFAVKGVSTKIKNNTLFIVTEYNFPIAPSAKNKEFVVSSDFIIKNGKIKATKVKLDSAYGHISLTKVANLLNLLNPLEFTMQLLEAKQCDANIENVKIVDNKVQINGKINIKGERG